MLAKYINRYTARNTADYFIHKDLGGFLRRELDFYIKNEIMRLDDMENENIPVVEGYLQKIKVLRNIAHKLIDFLAQLENFQKKLWLKKKFVVETNYCITLDRVPEEMYPDIVTNDAQLEEWVKLFSIEEIKGDLQAAGFSRPLTAEFFKENDKLVLDTKFFDEDFKARLIDSVEYFDKQCDGLLVHSENFQALNLLRERYKEQVKCIYIDPPYNTAASEILYKNSYKHSSWNSLIFDRICAGKEVMMPNGFQAITIDYAELFGLGKISDSIFGEDHRVGIVTIFINPKGRQHERFFSSSTEYMLVYTKNINLAGFQQTTIDDKKAGQFEFEDSFGKYRLDEFARIRSSTQRHLKPDFYYPIYVSTDLEFITLEENKQYHIIYPKNEHGKEYSWKVIKSTFQKNNKKGLYVAKFVDGILRIFNKFYENQVYQNLWKDKKYFPEFQGTAILKNMFSDNIFSYPKSVYAVKDYVKLTTQSGDFILDYFAGSGTTAHAVIDLNREDGGKRKYILVEMGDYFDTVLRPRVAKAAYSADWKDGKPTARDAGVSHCFKYIRLESYEDTLNNLRFDEDPIRRKILDDNTMLREDYMLRYLLDVETRDSQSLLNIDRFVDPTSYTLKVKKPGTDEYVTRTVDLIETFNYLIGLRVRHISVPHTFAANFRRVADPGLPEGQDTKLEIDGHIQQDAEGPWQFRKVEGWAPGVPTDLNNDQRERVLIIWRNLTGNLEKDNLMLDEWFRQNCISACEFDIVYVNGSNNLLNLRPVNEKWTVRLIEEEFMRRMWDVKDV